MPIDWSVARTPNFFEQYQDSFERGRALALQRMEAEKLGWPETHDAAETADDGDPFAALHGMSGREREANRNHAEVLLSVLSGLSAIEDQAQRLSAARHVAGEMPHFGIRPEDLTAAQLSDEALAGEMSRLAAFLQATASNDGMPDGWAGG